MSKNTQTPMKKLAPSACFSADYKRNIWQAYPEPGVTPADLLDPGYWSNIAGMLRPYDRIEALVEDGGWWAELLVLEVGHNWAKVMMLREVEIRPGAESGPSVDQMSEHEIRYRGVKKWSVVRKADSAVLVEDLKTKEEAVGWLGAHLKAMAA